MPSIFWIGVGFAAVICAVSALIGARSPSASFASGAAIGAFAGFMIAFPLIAVGLSTS